MEITEVFLVDVLRAIRGLHTKEQVDTYIDNLTYKHASLLWALFRHIERHVTLTEGNLRHTKCFLCTWWKTTRLYDRLRACQHDDREGGHVEFKELCAKLRAGLSAQGIGRGDLLLPGEAKGDREPVAQDP